MRPSPEPPPFIVTVTLGLSCMKASAAAFARGSSAEDPEPVMVPLRVEVCSPEALPVVEVGVSPPPAQPVNIDTESKVAPKTAPTRENFMVFLSYYRTFTFDSDSKKGTLRLRAGNC